MSVILLEQELSSSLQKRNQSLLQPIKPKQQTDILSWDEEKIFTEIYRPLQEWLFQFGIHYPWAANSMNNASFCPTLSMIQGISKIDSYTVWISEVMLQQTRITAVIPFYRRWIEKWPTLADLAMASQDQVLKQWEGLGYYNRAINLHLSAQKLFREQGPHAQLPNDIRSLQNLPGIGAYIAAAIVSLSDNQAALAFDTNVRRIFSRLYQQQIETKQINAWKITHQQSISRCTWRGSANISLIQLGQQVCTAKKPKCLHCPLQTICPSKLLENWDIYPKTKTKHISQTESNRILYKIDRAILLIQNRKGHLQHVWRLPSWEVMLQLYQEIQSNQPHVNESHIAPPLQDLHLLASLDLSQDQLLGHFTHSYLNQKEKILVFHTSSISSYQEWVRFLKSIEEIEEYPINKQWKWAVVSPREMQNITIAGPHRKFINQIHTENNIE